MDGWPEANYLTEVLWLHGPLSIGPTVPPVKDQLSQDIMSGICKMLSMPTATKKAGARAKRKVTPWDVRFGGRLKGAREAKGLSQPQMAEKLGMPVDTYQKYEQGKRSFPKHQIADVIRITGHGPWYMLTGEPEANCPTNQPRTLEGDHRPTQAKERRPSQ